MNTLHEEVIELHIVSIAYGGMGIARHENLVYFVPATIPGEIIRAKVTDRKKNYVVTEVLEILSASPDRIVPQCPYFQKCGGCSYLHINYALQRDLKKQQIFDILTRLGKLSDPPLDEVRCTLADLHYRNRITVHKRKPFANTIGFFALDNKSIVPIKLCLIAHNDLNRTLEQIRQTTDMPTPFDEIVIAHDTQKTVALFTARRTHQHAPFYYSDEIFSAKECPPFSFTIDGITLEYNVHTFFQTNNAALELLCAELRTVSFEKSEVLIDAYCGVGTFSLLLHDRFEDVVGIEENQRACEFAQSNALKNKISNVRFINARVEQGLGAVLAQYATRPCTVLLDPPRTGLSNRVVAALTRVLPHTIVYLSCEPTTLARDLALFSSHYTIERVIPFDMFPQTKHIETLVILRK